MAKRRSSAPAVESESLLKEETPVPVPAAAVKAVPAPPKAAVNAAFNAPAVKAAAKAVEEEDDSEEDEDDDLDSEEEEDDDLDSEEEEEEEEDEEVVIDEKLEKALRASGKIRDPINGKWPAGYKPCSFCGRGIHIKANPCKLCGTFQPRKEPSPNAGVRSPMAVTQQPSYEEVFRLLDATIEYCSEFDSIQDAMDDLQSAADYLEEVGGLSNALSAMGSLAKRRERQSD